MVLVAVAVGGWQACAQTASSLPDAPKIALTGSVQTAAGQAIEGATVTADGGEQATTDAQGAFRLVLPAKAASQLTIAAPGFATRTLTGAALPLVVTLVPSSSEAINVTTTQQEIGVAQVQAMTKQRVLGVFPNYFVVYADKPVKMTPKQKFTVAAKLQFDPVTIGLVGMFAGIEQATNAFPGYGQGAAGYFKRFGATLADAVDSTLLAGAVLPVLLRQDPRYFYSGKGSVVHRTGYAAVAVVRTRGDNGRWQPNYSLILGNLAAAGISNAYYPRSDRHGAQLTVENSLIGTGLGAVGNIIEEFLIKHITPKLPDYTPQGTPQITSQGTPEKAK